MSQHRVPSSVQIIESNPLFLKGLNEGSQSKLSHFFRPKARWPSSPSTESLSEGYGMGMKKTSGVVDKCFTQKVQELKPTPAVSKRLPSKVKGSDKLRSEPSNGEWQSQQSAKFNVLATVWKSCIRAFSFMRKASRVVLKDKEH